MERDSDWQIDINVSRRGALPVEVATDPGPGYGRGVKAGVGGSVAVERAPLTWCDIVRG